MNLVRQYIERSSGGHGQHATPTELPKQQVLAITIQRARTFQRLKEEAKHYCLIELAQIRQLLLAIDKKCNLNGRIFHLNLDEVISLAEDGQLEAMSKLAEQRFEAAQAWQSKQLPSTLSVSDLERLDMLTGLRPDAIETGELSGKRVAGEHEVTGVVHVITDVSQIESFKQGEILIARMTDPTWYPLFSQAKGIVTEVGGWLSHAAIVAREYDLPAIVGVSGICNQLKTGDVVTLKLDGSIEIGIERRDEASPMREAEVVEQSAVPSSDTVKATVMAADSNVYQLSDRKLFRFHRGQERRALKENLGDRRVEPRVSASGETQPDRRAANRAANLASILKKAS